METYELVELLKTMRDRSQRHWEKSLGKRGGNTKQSIFYSGASAVLDNIVYAVENDDLKYLDSWADQ